MAYKFIKTIDETNRHCVSNVEFTLPSNELTLDQMLEEFELFLRASSFVFTGKLDIVPDEESV